MSHYIDLLAPGVEERMRAVVGREVARAQECVRRVSNALEAAGIPDDFHGYTILEVIEALAAARIRQHDIAIALNERGLTTAWGLGWLENSVNKALRDARRGKCSKAYLVPIDARGDA